MHIDLLKSAELLSMRFEKQKYTLWGLLLVVLVGCSPVESPVGDEPQGFVEREAQEIFYTNAEVAYMGDDVGEESSDGWMLKFYTDMESDALGNPIGEGSVLQILLNGAYNYKQEPNVQFIEGIYNPQVNSGDFAPFTFVDGYMEQIELPSGRIELPASTYFGYFAEGGSEMQVDLLDDGAIEVRSNGDGSHTIEGVLVGQRCIKHRFLWKGIITPTSYVEPEVPNSTIGADKVLTGKVKGAVQDRGDYFGLRDESCRVFLLFLGEESVDLTTNQPKGSGRLIRLELLVPWDSKVADGVPAGEYGMVSRNDNTSIDREALVPFATIPGLPDCFNFPYWSGAWYVEYALDAWGEEYARIDSGSVVVERTPSGAHRITCELKDCATPSHTITVDVEVESLIVL